MTVSTRRQDVLVAAMKRVNSVKSPDGTDRTKDIAKKYGVLCHKLPIMIRNDGLAQTIAWIEEKSSDARTKPAGSASSLAEAYQHLRAHVAETLGMTDASTLAGKIVNAGSRDYQRYTATLFDAWVFHKRFAVSLLGVEASETDEDKETLR
jgi:CRISPR-associated protein Cmr5